MNNQNEAHYQMLRHTLATVAYRARKALHDAPDGFSTFRAREDSRSGGEILSHMCDLYDWAIRLATNENIWTTSSVGDWDGDAERFFQSLGRLDAYLAQGNQLLCPAERLFQGPIADSLTHIGQIAMLRRLAESPVRGENYFKATITTGTTGTDQAPPVFEFD